MKILLNRITHVIFCYNKHTEIYALKSPNQCNIAYR